MSTVEIDQQMTIISFGFMFGEEGYEAVSEASFELGG
jgi:hypothetical protein